MENNLGKSIVKATWILSVAMVLCVIMIVATKNKYTTMNSNNGIYYLNQQTGDVYSASGRPYKSIE